jgi:hypothetical protein
VQKAVEGEIGCAIQDGAKLIISGTMAWQW